MTDIENIERSWMRAQELKKLGDRQGALFLFKKMASEGYKYALFEVAVLHELGGGGISPDIREAIKWYEKAINIANDEYAIFALGRIYFTGMEGRVRYHEAFRYFYMLRSSKQAGAIYALGIMSEKGWGTPKSSDSAIYYYTKAARMGHLLAFTRLGIVSLKKFKILFGLRCLWISQIEYSRLRSKNPKDWRIGIKVVDTENEIVYRFSLLD